MSSHHGLPPTPHLHNVPSPHPRIPPFRPRRRPDTDPLLRFNRRTVMFYGICTETTVAPDLSLAVTNQPPTDVHTWLIHLDIILTDAAVVIQNLEGASSLRCIRKSLAAPLTFADPSSTPSTSLQDRLEPVTRPCVHASISVDFFGGRLVMQSPDSGQSLAV
ncbi:hypothetical protein B0H17DRAFT_1153884 [Mycena rosella]|uniref:Uncharacterized protein n=1 Tax=Mycena rosella TaxID=1033263 RepID=A0AAD7B2F7_MYCRO|nr:hypothetical protein B0H17DRAFT_1153884 [Mycena rosella]